MRRRSSRRRAAAARWPRCSCARLAGAVDFLTALGTGPDAERSGAELRALGVTVHAGSRPDPQRRTFTFLDDDAERTITVLGERIVPRARRPAAVGRRSASSTRSTSPAATRARCAPPARRACSSRRRARWARWPSRASTLDVLVGSAHDAGEVYEPGMLSPEPRVVVRTERRRRRDVGGARGRSRRGRGCSRWLSGGARERRGGAGRRRRCRARRSTPTAAATRSPPRSPTASARA